MPRDPSRLHPRLLLDVSVRDLVLAALACSVPWSRGRHLVRILEGRPGALVCFSVRSGFDLLLEALALPPGSEIVFSAVTHPDMPRIAESRGLRPLPVDLDLRTLAPEPGAVERLLSERTRAIVVAHLFGGRVDLTPLAAIARSHGLLLVEDCAQCLRDASLMPDPNADVSMFSFGTIKTATALGGAVLRVSDEALASRMRAVESRWPAQRRISYLRKVLKTLALVLVGRPRPYALLARSVRDVDHLVHRSVRGFPGDALLTAIRRRPSTPLLWLLARRLNSFDSRRLRDRAAIGDEVRGRLPAGLAHPGADTLDPTHWVFPVLAPRPDVLVARLRAAGFDAARATTGITAVAPPPDRPELRPTEAERLMSSVVFLPVYPELPARERERMLEVLT